MPAGQKTGYENVCVFADHVLLRCAKVKKLDEEK
jgi:hypothetical protein